MRKRYFLIFVFCTCFVLLSRGQSNNIKTTNIVKFSAFPNPVNQGVLTIKTFNTREKEVTIYNVLGKKIFTQKFSGTMKQLNVSEISSGIYIMKVVEGDKVATKKLVIK
ncbi:hypothetical protein KCTC32516_00906 [Polaribacter huanghezhanensis]|uniref:T9SS type A sorting domain-containing protein n=1 Tax=Polaribacter huanghezhanensis TaxID=1354726 RepID=UPI00264977C4|nr:T9SS type A sorting domain-containing protein [Polaribacter huanghezhanensis]WKD85565.1 hypothetical protein KCTC32516_00906 [Polaribacter huanghezhanensis]